MFQPKTELLPTTSFTEGKTWHLFSLFFSPKKVTCCITSATTDVLLCAWHLLSHAHRVHFVDSYDEDLWFRAWQLWHPGDGGGGSWSKKNLNSGAHQSVCIHILLAIKHTCMFLELKVWINSVSEWMVTFCHIFFFNWEIKYYYKGDLWGFLTLQVDPVFKVEDSWTRSIRFKF